MEKICKSKKKDNYKKSKTKNIINKSIENEKEIKSNRKENLNSNNAEEEKKIKSIKKKKKQK